MQAAIELGASSKVGVSTQAASALAHPQGGRLCSQGPEAAWVSAHHQARLSSVSGHSALSLLTLALCCFLCFCCSYHPLFLLFFGL
jgi:hypothetical protein